eukprot:Skav209838  [mRNA]  locus=scaffold2703:273246:297320:- [translate_table: standard]
MAAPAQTQLLAMNLQQAPKVAEAILQMMHAHQMTPEFLIQYFSRLSPETAEASAGPALPSVPCCVPEALECLTDLMRHNRQNLQVAVKVAIQYHEQIGAVKIVEMFESFGSNEGIFYFLGAILNTSTDPDVHFKYIQAASRVGNMQEVERVCRESQVFRFQVRAACPAEPLVEQIEKRRAVRYLVERQSPDLWALVLTPDNQERERVSATVKAFISRKPRARERADLPTELIELLEKIVLHNSDFSKNRNLQNLLVLTAIKADKARVMDYINRLDNYDGPEIAKIALGDPYGLYEEAFLIYKKCQQNAEAMDVLLENINSLERAQEFAARINDKTVWYKLGKAQLENGSVPEAVDSYLKSEDATDYLEVIQEVRRRLLWAGGLRDLPDVPPGQGCTAHSFNDDTHCDLTAMLGCLADLGRSWLDGTIEGIATGNLLGPGIQALPSPSINGCNVEPPQDVAHVQFRSRRAVAMESVVAWLAAEREENYEDLVRYLTMARTQKKDSQIDGELVYAYAKTERLVEFPDAVHPDHLEEVISQYEKQGCFDALMQLLESGLGNERAHVGMYTELATMYAKYKPKMLMDFIKMNVQKLNIPKLIHACERHYHWEHAVFLYTHYDEYDQAANTMMAHSPIAFAHDQFLMIMQKARTFEILFLMPMSGSLRPLQLNSLLSTITPKADERRNVYQKNKRYKQAIELAQQDKMYKEKPTVALFILKNMMCRFNFG